VTDLATAFRSRRVRACRVVEPAEANILRWADTTFTVFGPMNERSTRATGPREMHEWLATLREDLAPGSMGRAIFAAADAGKIATESCRPLITAYITAGIDTTINSISSAVHLFATTHPMGSRSRAMPGEATRTDDGSRSGGSRHPTQRRCVTLTYGAWFVGALDVDGADGTGRVAAGRSRYNASELFPVAGADIGLGMEDDLDGA